MSTPIPADARPETYLPLLRGQRVAILSNHTGMVGEKHLLDILLEHGIRVTLLFAPEHGFRGSAAAGEAICDETDAATGLPIRSLYNHGFSRPAPSDLRRFDVLVVDLQDVGLRFYTHYVAMLRAMEACADGGRKVVVLDRPNPNIHLVDGPVLEPSLRSDVGAIPVPVLHGLTLGELARMANGEGWLECRSACELDVVPCAHYSRRMVYAPPVPPSPNLRSLRAVYLYPSLCPFEGTILSVGRGTEHPFLRYGHPDYPGRFRFTPASSVCAGQPCRGVDLSAIPLSEARRKGFSLEYIIDAYRRMGRREDFFKPFFDKLVGRADIRPQIRAGATAEEFAAQWAPGLAAFRALRKPYLLYGSVAER